MTTKEDPAIGIILDWEKEGSFSNFPYFALRTHYIEAVRLAGGIPWLIPYGSLNEISSYLNNIDGLLIPGGFYATPNKWYQNINNSSPYQKTPRFEFEAEILKRAIDLDKSLLCICAGMQVLAGLTECTLTPNIKNYIGNNVEHFDLSKNHDVTIKKNTTLYNIIGKSTINTNSHHNEAVISVSNAIKISARSSDNSIEAIEMKNKKFILGLQWHPEMLCSKEEQIKNFNPHHLIFREFIKNASRN